MTTAFGTGVTGPDGRSLDQIQLSGVSARGYHGVLPTERQTGQEFRADVVLHMDTRPAAAGDDLAQTVSYADVAQDVHDILTGDPADLVETVAERIAAAVLARPQVEAVDVRVHKPHAPIPVTFSDVEVAIRRDRTHLPAVPAPHAAVRQDQAPSAGSPAVHEQAHGDAFPAGPSTDVWDDTAEQQRDVSGGGLYDGPEPQDFEPVPRPVTEEPGQLATDAFTAEPLVRRVPTAVTTARSAAEEPGSVPAAESVTELAVEPLQVIPVAWDLPADDPVRPEQLNQLGQEPPFLPEQQFQPELAFEPVQQYEPVQQFEPLHGSLDQQDGFEQQGGLDQQDGFEQQAYDRFSQPHEPVQPEQQFQPFDQPQQLDQQGFEAPQPFEPQPQRDTPPNPYDQMFEQQYDQGDTERTQVSAAVPDPAVAQPEQAYTPEQYQPEPRDRFDEVPAGYVDVVIAIGANLGDPQATMRSAVAELDRMPGLQVTDVSPLARTAAVGGPEQPDYLNAVLLARTTLSARGLLRVCQEVENVHGRTREEHWGPRTLDVDLITYGTLTDAAEDLEVPHPRAHERAFVLEPWSQIAPDAVLPGLGGGPVAQLAATAPDRTGIRWLALDWLSDPEPGPDGGSTPVNPAAPDERVRQEHDAHTAERPPALPPSLPPSGRPQASPGGPVVEVPGGGHPQGHTSGPVDLEPRPHGSGHQDAYPAGPHPQTYSSGPVPGGPVPVPQQAPPAGPPAGTAGNGPVVPPPEEALVPTPIAPRAVRDTAHEVAGHEPPAGPPLGQAKPVFAPVNPSRQQAGAFPPLNGAGPVPDQAAPAFAPVSVPVDGVPDPARNGQANGQPANGQQNGHQDTYDSDHTVIRVPGFVSDQRAAPVDGPIDSVPAWVPVRDERGRDA